MSDSTKILRKQPDLLYFSQEHGYFVPDSYENLDEVDSDGEVSSPYVRIPWSQELFEEHSQVYERAKLRFPDDPMGVKKDKEMRKKASKLKKEIEKGTLKWVVVEKDGKEAEKGTEKKDEGVWQWQVNSLLLE